MKVLIIEDEEPMRRALCNCFLGQGIAQAADMPEMIRALEGEAFDLVLADLRLPPDNDPAKTLAHVRAHSGGAVVVAISGGDISPEIANAADGAIQKADLRNCIALRKQIEKIIDSVKLRPPYEAHVRAVSAWAIAYGDQATAAPNPPPPPTPSLSMRRPVGASAF